MTTEIRVRNWRHHRFSDSQLWMAGYLYDPDLLFDPLKNTSAVNSEAVTPEFILSTTKDLDGQFAFIYRTTHLLFAACDRIRSHPIFYLHFNGDYYVSNNPLELVDSLGLTVKNQSAALSIGMAGFASGGNTIFEGLYQIPSGCLLIIDLRLNTHHIVRYYNYQPWHVKQSSFSRQKEELRNVTLTALEKTIESVKDRAICVSISAGLDSRAILSGLHYLNYKNVKCFSYGLHGNYEASAGKRIADKLNFDYYFVKKTPALIRRMLESPKNKRYVRFADTCAAVPTFHQFYSIGKLKEVGFVSEGDVFVNGYSGDFLTGGHIPEILRHTKLLSLQERKKNMLNFILDKHYSLWNSLKTPNNIRLISEMISHELDGIFFDGKSGEFDFAVYENYEWKNRQTLWSMNQPRIYEYWGHEWRFPLWDRNLIDFWEHIPIESKFGQKLYREMLHDNDWGGVWQNFPCPRYDSPRPIAALNRLTGLLMTPLIGPIEAQKLQRKYFAYWLETLCYLGFAGYKKTIGDRKGYRNALSWWSADYLESKSRDYFSCSLY